MIAAGGILTGTALWAVLAAAAAAVAAAAAAGRNVWSRGGNQIARKRHERLLWETMK